MGTREISGRTGLHPRTVKRIIRTGKVFPLAYDKVTRDIERFPFASVEERASRLGLSKGYISRMYGLVFFSDRTEGKEWMAEYLVRVGLYELAAGLLRILPFSYGTYRLMNALPDGHLTPQGRILPFVLSCCVYLYEHPDASGALARCLQARLKYGRRPYSPSSSSQP